jgi:cell division inhibitor SulA
MKAALVELLHHPLVWRGDQLASSRDAIPSGFADLDAELPGGGWPKDALIELLRDAEGVAGLRLLAPALASLARAGEWIVLVAPPYIPYAPALAAAGIHPAQVIVVAATEEKHRWWAAEQVLRANSAGALLFWPQLLNHQRLRRLQLAAQEGSTPGFVFASTARAAQPSPSPLRIRLSTSEKGLRIDMFKRRGGMMARPLLLDVSMAARIGESRGTSAAVRRLPSRLERVPAQRPPGFHRQYPVGASRQIWNRALARADEVRRIPGPDPREGSSSRPPSAALKAELARTGT